MTAFQRLCLATTAIVFVLIIIGGTVRATDSGLGCPDWPRCHGSFIPKIEKHTLIEYSHRLTASVAGLMVFAITAWAWKSYRDIKSIYYPAIATFVLLLVQGGLGGLTVVHELPPEIVTVHLATALTLFALLILVTVSAFGEAKTVPRLQVSANLSGLAIVAAGLAAAVMLLGVYVAVSGYSLACGGWPLCNSQAVPTLSSESVRMVFIHRLLALALGGVLLTLALSARRGPRASKQVADLALAAFAVYVAQALVGAANIWTEVADAAQIAHLAVGTMLWAVLAYLNIRLFDVPGMIEAGASHRAAARALVGAAR